MHYYEVAPIRIVRVGSDVFTYQSADELQPGHIVIVPVGSRELVGLVMRKVPKPVYATKPVTRSVSTLPLPSELVRLAEWMSGYYLTPLATVLQTILPRGVEKTRRLTTDELTASPRDRTKNVFNKEQLAAVTKIDSAKPGTFLLQGITGSGKTEVYIELIQRTLALGKSAIVMVPEIALTAQLLAEFQHHFPRILMTHSGMTEAERHLVWQTALHTTEPLVVIGPRSALFMPLPHIGIIVADEAHEPSYKQEQSPRYSALRAATMLGQFHEAKVILASATPLLTDRYLAAQHDSIASLTGLARPGAMKPAVTIVDMTKRDNLSTERFFSKSLIRALEETVAAGHQALIYHNRRGSATTTLCTNCGWAALCPRCFVPLTLHADAHQLRCHICDHHELVPTMCPVCSSVDIIYKGAGTKLIEIELVKLFPKARIARFDADTAKDAGVDARYDELYRGDIDIIIGTQVVAKGLDLPHLRLVGVIQADSGLALPDYGARERTFELLAQVIGRVGRNEHPSRVIVQTYQPNHSSIQAGIAQDYESFYVSELDERRRGQFPPFRYLLKLTCSYKTEAGAVRAARTLARNLEQTLGNELTILGPTPAFYERERDNYRWQLVVKSTRREPLLRALELVPSSSWQAELDPVSLL